jgi:hypothetical protein
MQHTHLLHFPTVVVGQPIGRHVCGPLGALPIIVARLPVDYCIRDQHHTSRRHPHSTVLRLLRLVSKHLLGIVFVLADEGRKALIRYRARRRG